MPLETGILTTKLHRPRVSDDVVLRPRLLDRLNQGLERKLTLVSAPAGFGKTTLVASWLESCHRPSAWLSLDENDNDLFLFLSYLIAAIRTLYPQACGDAWGLVQSPQPPPSDSVTTSLINGIAELPEAFVLALDDFHHIHDDAIQQLMAKLILAQPAQLHLVIASRTVPVLPLPRLRGSHQMTEIRTQDLRFSVEEARQFLQRAVGEDLDRATATGLQQRTEGWIVGLRLAALSMEGAGDWAAILDGFAGDTNEFVMDYLVSEVLHRQPEPRQRFLLQTSILDRFCADLCDAVSEAEGKAGQGQVFLDELWHANLFLIPLDEERGWFRYHHLFRDMLRHRALLRFGRDEIQTLHCRAAAWFAAQGSVEEAIRHALSADDVELATGLVEDQSEDLLNRWDRATLERWLAMLPEEAVWHRPKLLIARAWVLFRQWRMTALESVLDQAETALDVGPGGPASKEQRSTNGQILALRCATDYVVHSEYERSLASSRLALQQLPAGARGARGIAAMFRAFSQQALGQHDRAVSRLQEAIDDPSPFSPSKVQTSIGLSMVHLNAGELAQMQQTSDYFLALIEGATNPNAILGANWVSGLLYYEWNDLQAARGHFSKVYELRYHSNFMASFTAALGLARIHELSGDMEQAQELLTSLREQTLLLNNSDLLPQLEAAQAQQWLYQGDTVSALRWARSFQREPLQDNMFKFELPVLTKTRILVSAGTTDEMQAMRSHLQMQASTLEAHHFTNRTIQVLAHLALLELRLGFSDDALEALQRALYLGQPGGFVRSIVDAGPGLVPLLERLKERDVAPDYVSTLLAAFGPTTADSREALPEPLTRREREILRLMGRGLTNPEIAEELVISPHTVRTHATHIYAKLAVGNRARAVRKARQLGIIS